MSTKPAKQPSLDSATTKSQQGAHPATPTQDIDRALDDLTAKKGEWVRLPVRDRCAILRELRKDFADVAARWVDASAEAKGVPLGTPATGEEWLAGPYLVVRNLRLLEEALVDIDRRGQPKIPGAVEKLDNGRVSARVFPQNLYDQVLFTGVTADVWMSPEVTVQNLANTQAVAYRRPPSQSSVCLVLGAGNVSSIAPMDILYKLFVDNEVVITKMHPVNDYLGPLMATGFQALIDWGVLRIVYGGAEEGAYLCEHPNVDTIHITGSDKTVEAIVFGPGEEGRQRKAERRPKLAKPITSELGNVSPVIVVPGPWTAADLAYHGRNLAAMLANNAGFNCNATRVILQHAGWSSRWDLIEAFDRALSEVAPRKAYYPGADERFAAFIAEHPGARRIGDPEAGELPWTLIPAVDSANSDDIVFRTEAFCGIAAETALEADSVIDFIGKAVAFANRRLWGTLNAMILVHPQSMHNVATAAAVEKAIADLRYGTVSVNQWAALGYGLSITPWGAFPGHDIYDIQSGTGVVHNTLMFSRVEKTVVRAPFRMQPKPVWFQGHRTAHRLARKLTDFEASPAPWKLPSIFWEALRG